jgi:hypothetical protein
MGLGIANLNALARYQEPVVVGGDVSAYLAHGAQTSPYLDLLSISGSTLTDLTSQPDVSPGGPIFASSGWSPDGNYFATYTTGSPYLKIYKRTGASFSHLTSAVDTQVSPSNSATTLMWSPDGNFIAISGGSGNPDRMIWYSWNAGTETATKLTNPTTLPSSGSNTWSLAWNPTSDAILMGMEGAPYFRYYTRSGNTLTADFGVFAGTVSPSSRFFGAQWSHDGSRFAIAMFNLSETWVYSDDGDGTYTLEATLSGGKSGVVWSPDDSLLMMNGGSPNLTAYHRSGSTYTNITANIDAQPAAYADRQPSDFNDDGSLFCISHHGAVDIALYSVSYAGTSTTFTKQSIPSGLSSGYGNARFQFGSMIIY